MALELDQSSDLACSNNDFCSFVSATFLQLATRSPVHGFIGLNKVLTIQFPRRPHCFRTAYGVGYH